jgi:hypothetical protein
MPGSKVFPQEIEEEDTQSWSFNNMIADSIGEHETLYQFSKSAIQLSVLACFCHLFAFPWGYLQPHSFSNTLDPIYYCCSAVQLHEDIYSWLCSGFFFQSFPIKLWQLGISTITYQLAEIKPKLMNDVNKLSKSNFWLSKHANTSHSISWNERKSYFIGF